MQDQKKCVVCSMPLVKDEDYPEGADTSKVDWCKFCGDKDGMKSYEEAIAGMSQFMQNSQGMEEEQAKIAAKQAIDNSEAVKSGRMSRN